ncbi:hypothetical protein Adt_18519 [Abeliophyllum distichum]|uniref:Uncharacterized protein n=1 Tax=Abeliophyllum distichum TaxID=126358 RepID=A0ABD1TJS5_9LAMI
MRELRPRSSEEAHQKKMIEEVSLEAAHEEAKCLVPETGEEDKNEEEVAPFIKKLRVGYCPQSILSRLVRREGCWRWRQVEKERNPFRGHCGARWWSRGSTYCHRVLIEDSLSYCYWAIVLGDALSGSKGKDKRNEKVFVDLASSGGEQEVILHERHSQRMLEELIGNVRQKFSTEAIEDLDLQASLGAQAFNRYIP